jgi:hypothetical protein
VPWWISSMYFIASSSFSGWSPMRRTGGAEIDSPRARNLSWR